MKALELLAIHVLKAHGQTRFEKSHHGLRNRPSGNEVQGRLICFDNSRFPGLLSFSSLSWL